LSDWVTSSAGAKGWSQAINFAIPQGERFVSLILIAWIMMPIAIRLLRVPSAELPSADEKKLGRYFVILTGVGGIALSATLSPLLFKVVLPGRFPQLVYSSLISLVLSFPFLLGQIGVALIAVGGDWNPGETPAILKWRRLVRSMMPLHSEPREKL